MIMIPQMEPVCRDYIHVVDLAKGHVKALKKLEENAGLKIYNLGTGVGYSVLDIVKNFEAATGVKIPYVIKPQTCWRYRHLLFRCISRQRRNLAGRLKTASRRCAKTPGDGRRTIRTDTKNK